MDKKNLCPPLIGAPWHTMECSSEIKGNGYMMFKIIMPCLKICQYFCCQLSFFRVLFMKMQSSLVGVKIKAELQRGLPSCWFPPRMPAAAGGCRTEACIWTSSRSHILGHEPIICSFRGALTGDCIRT